MQWYQHVSDITSWRITSALTNILYHFIVMYCNHMHMSSCVHIHIYIWDAWSPTVRQMRSVPSPNRGQADPKQQGRIYFDRCLGEVAECSLRSFGMARKKQSLNGKAGEETTLRNETLNFVQVEKCGIIYNEGDFPGQHRGHAVWHTVVWHRYATKMCTLLSCSFSQSRTGWKAH